MSKLSNLLQQAAVIRDATEEHENTAVRVGTMFVDFIQSCLDVLPPEIVDATGISTSTSETNFVVRYRTVDDTGASVSKSITIPAASSANAGLLSTSLLAQINQVITSVTAAVSELATVRGIAEGAQTTATRAEGKADAAQSAADDADVAAQAAQSAADAAQSAAEAVAATVEAMKKYGYKFMGVATPATDPGTPSENVFYLATTEGYYTHFPTNAATEEGPLYFTIGADEVAILRYTKPTDDTPIVTNWSKVTLNLAKGTAITEIRTAIETLQSNISDLEDGLAPRLFFNGNVLTGTEGDNLSLAQFVALTAGTVFAFARKKGVVVALSTADGLKNYQWKGTTWNNTYLASLSISLAIVCR